MKRISALSLSLLISTVLPSGAAEYHVDKEADNLVKFISKAPLEEFEGVTDRIDGYVLWFGPDSLEKSEVYLEVELGDLDTGIGLRNRHMRDNYLETDKYPYAQYSGKCIDIQREQPAGVHIVTCEGTMKIHGVENPLQIQGRVEEVDNGIRVATEFSVELPDYDIAVPKVMFLKINETIRLDIRFTVKQITGETP